MKPSFDWEQKLIERERERGLRDHEEIAEMWDIEERDSCWFCSPSPPKRKKKPIKKTKPIDLSVQLNIDEPNVGIHVKTCEWGYYTISLYKTGLRNT